MLDTNIASQLVRNPSGRVAERVRAAADEVCLSIIVAAELRFGAAKGRSPSLRERIDALLSTVPVLPWDRPVDVYYGVLRAELEEAGRPIGGNDFLIAAHAQVLGATLVTANLREFRRVRGLIIENWME